MIARSVHVQSHANTWTSHLGLWQQHPWAQLAIELQRLIRHLHSHLFSSCLIRCPSCCLSHCSFCCLSHCLFPLVLSPRTRAKAPGAHLAIEWQLNGSCSLEICILIHYSMCCLIDCLFPVDLVPGPRAKSPWAQLAIARQLMGN